MIIFFSRPAFSFSQELQKTVQKHCSDLICSNKNHPRHVLSLQKDEKSCQKQTRVFYNNHQPTKK
jgi:hypothetical protein